MINSITLVVITYNEEKHLERCILSAIDIVERVVIVDSYSTDSTVEIAEKLNADVYYRNFDNFSDQRNFSLKETKIESDYVLVLDADEYITKEFKNWLLANKLDSDGYYINRRFYWKGTWLRRGYYPLWLLRLGRNGMLECDSRGINEHLILSGSSKIDKAKGDFIDENLSSISDWMSKHNNYSNSEAYLLSHFEKVKVIDQQSRKKWIRYNIWNKLPWPIRLISLIMYRLIFQRVWLDGSIAIYYMLLDVFVYRLLTEIKAKEIEWDKRK